jgi:hypothetical protein
MAFLLLPASKKNAALEKVALFCSLDQPQTLCHLLAIIYQSYEQDLASSVSVKIIKNHLFANCGMLAWKPTEVLLCGWKADGTLAVRGVRARRSPLETYELDGMFDGPIGSLS